MSCSPTCSASCAKTTLQVDQAALILLFIYMIGSWVIVAWSRQGKSIEGLKATPVLIFIGLYSAATFALFITGLVLSSNLFGCYP